MTDRIRLQKEVRGSKEEEARELLCSDECRKWRWQRWQGAKVKPPTLLDLTQETQTQVETRLDPKYARLGWRFALAKGALTEATWASFEFANLPPREHQLLLLGRLVLVTAAALEPFHGCSTAERKHCSPPPDTEVWSARGLRGYVTDTYGHLAKQEELMAKRPELRRNFAQRCFATLACQLSGTAALVVEELGADALGLDVELRDWLTRSHFVRSRRCPESEDEDWQDAQEDIDDAGATTDRSIAPPHRLSKAQAKALATVRTVLAQATASKPQALQQTKEISAALRHLKLPSVEDKWSKPSQEDKTSGSQPGLDKTSGSQPDQDKTEGSKSRQSKSLKTSSKARESKISPSRSRSSGSSSRAPEAPRSPEADELGRFSTPKAYLAALRDCLELSDLHPSPQRDLTFLSLARLSLPKGLGSSEDKTAPSEVSKETTKLPTKGSKTPGAATGTKMEEKATASPPARAGDAAKPSSSRSAGKKSSARATSSRPQLSDSEDEVARLVDDWRPRVATAKATKGGKTTTQKSAKTQDGHWDAAPQPAVKLAPVQPTPQPKAKSTAKPAQPAKPSKPDSLAPKQQTHKSDRLQDGRHDRTAKPAQPATSKPDSQSDRQSDRELAPKQWREALSRRLAPLVSLTPQLLSHPSVQTMKPSQLGPSHWDLSAIEHGAAASLAVGNRKSVAGSRKQATPKIALDGFGMLERLGAASGRDFGVGSSSTEFGRGSTLGSRGLEQRVGRRHFKAQISTDSGRGLLALGESQDVPFLSSYANQRRRLERLAQRLRRQRLCWKAASG